MLDVTIHVAGLGDKSKIYESTTPGPSINSSIPRPLPSPPQNDLLLTPIPHHLIQIILLGFELHFFPLFPFRLLFGLHGLTWDEGEEDDEVDFVRVFVFEYVPVFGEGGVVSAGR